MIDKKKNGLVLIADKIDNSGLAILKQNFSVIEFYGFSNKSLITKLKLVKPAILIIRSYRIIDANFIDCIKTFNTIKFICTASSGFDNIDVIYAKKNNIRIVNVPNGNYISAAEHTFALILSILKNIKLADNSVKNGQFNEGKFTNLELSNKKIGIIGVGRVGSKVAQFAKAFDMKIFGNDILNLQSKYKWIKFVSIDNLLSKSDIITLHVPLDDSTVNLLNSTKLKLIKKDSIIINCSRGEVINEECLIDCLKNRKIKFAGLDVYKNEPLINQKFIKLKNVLLTPHIAGKTIESKQRISFLLAKKILSLTKIKPQLNRKSTKLIN